MKFVRILKSSPAAVILREQVKKYRHLKFIYVKECRQKGFEESWNTYIKKNFLHTYVTFGNDNLSSMCNLINKLDINWQDTCFYYYLCPLKTIEGSGSFMANLTVDYEFLLKHSLSDIALLSGENMSALSESLIKYAKRVEKLMCKFTDNENAERISKCFNNMIDHSASSFFDAIQRILFANQFMWQTNHRLNGLGRMDRILEEYYLKDIENNNLNDEEALFLIEEFLKTLHRYYWFKSNMLMGDTGQIIILGGKTNDDTYFYNNLTMLFLRAAQEVRLPDPKILFRVSRNTPRELIDIACDLLSLGTGSPLFSNDDVIIPCMTKFGYSKADAFEYTVSACWEPTVAGKAVEMNNCKRLNFCNPLLKVLDLCGTNRFDSFAAFLNCYKECLRSEVKQIVEDANREKYEYDAFLKIFSNSATEKLTIEKHRYMNTGFTGTAMSNAINSLMNIKKYVYEDHSFTLDEIKSILLANYNGHENERKEFLQSAQFGRDDEDCILLCNVLINTVSSELNDKRNIWGDKFKFGLSSPNYITDCTDFPATPDGRMKGEPFGVHISAPDGVGLTELISFASQLNYINSAFNGNVIDYIVSPQFLQNERNIFGDLLELSIEKGFFQMQLNVLSSKTLIAARENPDEFPNLIVRVWGFSAYFNDLPDEYKDLLIQRAEQSERIA